MINVLNIKPKIIKKEKIEQKQITTLNIDKVEQLLSKNKQKLKFNLENINSEFIYNGLKIVVCDNPDIFVRDVLNNNDTYSNIFIGNYLLKNKLIFHIHSFSKISDFLNTKNNSLLHEYLKTKDIDKNNQEIQDFITKKYYDLNDKFLENLSDVVLEKATILDYINIKKDYLDTNNIIDLLNVLKDSNFKNRQLIIINDYQVLDINTIINNYSEYFDFLIITDDIKKWVNNVNFLECIIIINQFVKDEFNVDALEILDKNILLDYLEKRFFYEQKINNSFLNKNK